ncbi:DNA primase [Lysinibacillus sp. BW-2-10]|uniref:DNA primase n=1 Tax=Lysinibacillus sp. BW-2-10 TaxID=2590030 RepID=UPI00117D6CA2|nr:DNA primase [Lysinibacillus sp. BW-2-10]TSI03333.1 DNA primase [Lysinibacillus sp. BW-2-10]
MNGKIPEEMIEQIRSQVDIVDVISDYMQLTKKGRNWFGLCPFHGENTPSFSVSQDKQIFHCFGCSAGGNAITFVMDMDNIPFPNAVAKLGERIGIHLDIQSDSINNSSQSYSKKEEKMIEAHEFAAEFYHHLLMNTEDGEQALNYLLKRGFTKDHIETNGIGWSLPAWDTLSVLLKRKGFTLEEMAECGLIIHKESDHTYFDRFRGRVMFPIRDENGKVIAFSGRIIDSRDEAKYLNSPESPIFHKSQVLFNLDKARTSIRKQRQVILMEGFMDVLAANQAGVYNAVATMGTSLTQQHITKLKRLSEQIIICYDGDNAGWDAAKRAAEMLYAESLKVDIAVLPEKLDPDEYIRKYNAESFIKQILEKPHAYIAFMMMYARRNKNFQFENDVLQYIQEVLEQLVGRSSPIERDLYIKQLSNETNISEEAIYAQFRKLDGNNAKNFKRTEQRNQPLTIELHQPKTLTATDRAERLLLSHMLFDLEVVTTILKSEDTQPFARDEYRAVFVRLIGFYEEHQTADYQRFLEMIDDPALRKLVMEAALVDRDPDHAQAEIADCLRHLKKHRIEEQIKKLQHDSQEAEKMHEHKRALEMVQQIIQLRKSLSAI